MKNLLKMMRWEAGMKQYELAIKLHCSAPYLSLVENGRIDPPDEFKKIAAQIFKVNVKEIFPEKAAAILELVGAAVFPKDKPDQQNGLPKRSSHINFGAY